MSIEISKSVVLKTITMDDYATLLQLMQRIYPPAYNYLWPDNGEWYLNEIYGAGQVEEDLGDRHSSFYFVEVEGRKEGILKIQENIPFPDMPDKKATRLHRIYLSEKTQGRGISSALLNYVEKRAIDNGSVLIWLDCMDSKIQALRFYEKNGFQKGRLTFLEYKLIKKGFHGMYLMWKSLV